MFSLSWNIVISAVTLYVVVGASPARFIRNHELDDDEQEDPGREWERELLDLGLLRGGHERFPGADMTSVGDPRAFTQVNGTEIVMPYAESFDHVPGTTYYLEEVSPNDEELQLWELSNPYGYPEIGMPDGFVEDEYAYRPVLYEPQQHRTYSPDPLVESLAHFLGTPENNWEMGDHQVGDEVDFGDIWELDAVRQIGKEANVPQYLVDSVDPEADENLLELMVRIAENPEKWRSIHAAIERLDQAVGKMDESYERKDIEKRSSPYEGHYHPHKVMSHTKRKKLAKMKRKKTHDWGEEVPERSYGEKIRHDHRKEEYGSQFEKPRSAAYASVVFPNNENQNFDRWKVRYQPVEPEDVEGGVPKDYKHPQWPTRTNSDYNRYAKKKLKMKAMAKEAKEKASAKSAVDLRRWQILKFNKNLVDKWSKVKELRGHEAPLEEKHDDGGMSDKEKSLATNNWVTPKEHKENWPHFAYHRVTSSPGVQQRDAGAQPRHRSAYVAVSVVPTNSTGAADGKPHPSEPHHKQNKLPDLFDHVLDEQSRAKSLKQVEDKFQMGDSERLRLQQVMRDASSSSNRTT